MTITHGIDSALSSMDRIGLNGRLSFNEKGHGGGSAQITYKRILTSSLHLEVPSIVYYYKS
jgi:hypothetical protein